MSNMTPREIVHALDQHIIGQSEAKRAVAIALRNRWRRQQLEPDLRSEVTPKNILMIGDTIHDLELAVAMKIDVVLIYSGHQSLERLQAVHPQVINNLLTLI